MNDCAPLISIHGNIAYFKMNAFYTILNNNFKHPSNQRFLPRTGYSGADSVRVQNKDSARTQLLNHETLCISESLANTEKDS